MKKVCSIILVVLLLLPNLAFANGVIGPENPNKNLSRAEMATVSVRLLGLESLKGNYNKKGDFKDVKGWALPYVNIASEMKIMKGSSQNIFNPNGQLTYVEVLTVLMRILGYEDGIDFKKYPTDYYNKALEIGLGDLYIKDKEVITRSIASDTIDKALELNMKNSDLKLKDNLNRSKTEVPKTNDTVVENITISNIQFNSSIVGMFSGELKGSSYFTNYKVELLSKGGQVYETTTLGESGSFSILGFDVGVISQLTGYMYKVYDAKGNMILSSDLQ